MLVTPQNKHGGGLRVLTNTVNKLSSKLKGYKPCSKEQFSIGDLLRVVFNDFVDIVDGVQLYFFVC